MENRKLYDSYLRKLTEIGVDVRKLDEKYGERIMKSTFSPTTEYGLAYDGAMLDFVCKHFALYAIQESNLLRETDGIDVPVDQIVKVCFLCLVSKGVLMIPNDNDFKVKKGELYKYDDNVSKYGIRQGMKSLMMCMECGITFNDEEIDAMTTVDKLDDYTSKLHCSMLGYIIRRAYERALKVNQVKNKQQQKR